MFIVKKDGMTMINLDYVREIAVSENRIVYRTEDEKVKVAAAYDDDETARKAFREIRIRIDSGVNVIDLSLTE